MRVEVAKEDALALLGEARGGIYDQRGLPNATLVIDEGAVPGRGRTAFEGDALPLRVAVERGLEVELGEAFSMTVDRSVEFGVEAAALVALDVDVSGG